MNSAKATANSLDLTIEQEFHLQQFANQVKHLSLEQSHDFIVELYRQTIKKDNLYKRLLKKGLETSPQPLASK